ncbi:unnamed protein product [Rotaria magnacalcarata]
MKINDPSSLCPNYNSNSDVLKEQILYDFNNTLTSTRSLFHQSVQQHQMIESFLRVYTIFTDRKPALEKMAMMLTDPSFLNHSG